MFLSMIDDQFMAPGMQVKNEASVRVTHHGVEKQPVVVIDGFSVSPERLVEDARTRSFSAMGPYYPGIRAPAPASYLADASDLLEGILRDVFGIESGAALVECNYSVVTTPPGQLQPIQRLPHFDTTDPGRIALLHYLSRPDQGGTRFFRHRATGFETVTADRFDAYRDKLHEEAARDGLPPAKYFGSQSTQFEQVALHNAAFNRAIIYRGITLHSGAIPEGFRGEEDVVQGRLTVNTFFQSRN